MSLQIKPQKTALNNYHQSKCFYLSDNKTKNKALNNDSDNHNEKMSQLK